MTGRMTFIGRTILYVGASRCPLRYSILGECPRRVVLVFVVASILMPVARSSGMSSLRTKIGLSIGM